MGSDNRLHLAEDVMGRLHGPKLPAEVAGKQCRVLVLLSDNDEATAYVLVAQGHSRQEVTEYRLRCTGIKRGGAGRASEIHLAPLEGYESPFGSTIKIQPLCSCAMGSVAKHQIFGGAQTKRVRLPEWLAHD